MAKKSFKQFAIDLEKMDIYNDIYVEYPEDYEPGDSVKIFQKKIHRFSKVKKRYKLKKR